MPLRVDVVYSFHRGYQAELIRITSKICRLKELQNALTWDKYLHGNLPKKVSHINFWDGYSFSSVTYTQICVNRLRRFETHHLLYSNKDNILNQQDKLT